MSAVKGHEPPADGTTLEVPSDRELVISRSFHASARIVFEAWTRADLVRRWWAPRSLGVEMVECQADVRVGGTYRYVIRPSSGGEVAFSGRYREVTPYSRLVYAEVYEPMAGAGEVVVTVSFTEKDGVTHLVSHGLYPSKETLQATLATGMEKGMRDTMNQLSDLVESLKESAA